MAIDASIYGNLRPIDMPSILDSASKAMSLSQLALQNRKLSEADADQQAVKAAFSKNVGPDGTLNRQGVLSDLSKTAPMQALDYQGRFAEMDRAQADAKQKVLGDRINQLGMIAQLASSAKDQASYEAALGQAKNLGMDVSQLPPQFIPGLMQTYAVMSLNEKQRLEALTKTQEMDINAQKAPLERQKLGAEVAKLKGDAKSEVGKNASELRKERSGLPTTKATQEISAAYNKIQNAAKTPSAAGDMSMIFGYMKLLDPGSTVREGEQASAQQATGVPTRVLNAYNSAVTGQRLAPEQRADFLNQAKGLYDAQISQQNKIDRDYERLAIKQGVNPDDVLTNFGADVPDALQQQMAGGGSKGGGLIKEANAGERKSKLNVGAGGVVAVGNQMYRIGEDGDTLIPIQGKGSQ